MEKGERARVNAATRKLVGAIVRKFPSSTRAGVEYTAFMMPDGTTSCDCPAWIYSNRNGGGDRWCRHVNELVTERNRSKNNG